MGPPEKEVSDRNQYVFGDTNSSPVLRIRVSKAAVPRNLADIQFGCLYKVQYWWIRHSSLVQKCYPCFGIIFSLRDFSLTKKTRGPPKHPCLEFLVQITRKGTCEFHPRELCALGWALAVTKAWELPGSGFFGRSGWEGFGVSWSPQQTQLVKISKKPLP